MKNNIRPIENTETLNHIRQTIGPSSRDLLLFDLAIETGVTANQLLSLRTKHLTGLNIGDEILVLRGKKDRATPVTIGPQSHDSFQKFLHQHQPEIDDIIFKSRKGGKALTLPSVSRLVRGWFERAGLEGMSSFLSLRKTWEILHQNSYENTRVQNSSQTSPGYSANSIQPPTTQELVYKELEHAIVTARIKPGEKLVMETLAKQMGVSRIPIREAVGRLEARNFVTVHPQKGTTVNGLSEAKLREILEIRLKLELTAAEKATMNADKSIIATLSNLNDQYILAQKANDADTTLSINRKFHFTIYEGAKMPLLLSMIRSLWDQASPYYHLMFRQTIFHDPQTGRSHHQQIIDGIATNDPKKVSKWLKTDLTESTEFVLDVMRSLNTAKEII